MTVPQDYRDVIAYWTNVHDLTLSLDTNAYADGDVLADSQKLTNIVGITGGGGLIQCIAVLDLDDQGEALDIIFLEANVSIGTENAAVSVSDANAALIVGQVEVEAADFIDLVNSQRAEKTNLGIPFRCADGQKSLWIAAVSRGTGTYTALGIKLKVGILQGM